MPMPLQTLRWAMRPAAFMERCLADHGPAFTVRLAPFGPVVFLADPADIRAVFTAPPTRYMAADANRLLAPLVGSHSVLLLDGPEHMRQRRLMLPSFHGERLRSYATVAREETAAEVATWPVGRAFELRPAMQRITLAVIMRAVFGLGAGARADELRSSVADLLDAGAASALVALVPAFRRGAVGPWARFQRCLRVVDDLLYAEIRRRRAEPAEGEDVFTALLAARDEQGRPMSDGELRDELITLLVAGHETTATALAWAFERGLRHPAAFERLESEARTDDTSWADAVAREALRLRPVFSVAMRTLCEPTTLAGHDLPAGTRIAPCIHLVHRLPAVWGDPAAFRPERFLVGDVPPYAWIPFGGGSRRCLGAEFALLEMREVLREVARSAHLLPDGAPEAVRRRAVTLVPARGARALLANRP